MRAVLERLTRDFAATFVPRHRLHPGLSLGRPHDLAEQQADRVAGEILRSPRSARAPAAAAGRWHEPLPTNSVQAGPESLTTDSAAARRAPTPSGQPLDPRTRTFMESRFGHDFGRVRVHADARADSAARAVDAQAFTVGRDIFFAAGRFAPDTDHGRSLLAHELTHVLQQRAVRPPGPVPAARPAILQRQPNPPEAAEADSEELTPTEKVRKAVELLKGRDPVTIHKYLSQVQLGGPAVAVKTVTQGKGAAAKTSTFTLQLKEEAALPGHSIAQFQGVIPASGGAKKRTFAMTISVKKGLADIHPSRLADSLFHEGMHMTLFMDRLLPASERSVHLSQFEKYLAIAQGHENYRKFLDWLADYISSRSKKSPKTAKKNAEEIVHKIIEEKFVLDQTQRGKKQPQESLQERAARYKRLTTRWLVTYLDELQLTTRERPEEGTKAGLLMSIWLEIDNKKPSAGSDQRK